MNMVTVSVWVENDTVEPSIKYVRFYRGKASTAHDRFTKWAMRTFPAFRRIEIKEV